MKKFAVILLSMLLVLSIGQAALASSGNVGLKLGYTITPQIAKGALNANLTAEYRFAKWFSLAGGINTNTFLIPEEVESDRISITLISIDLSGKFYIYSSDVFNVGLELALKDTIDNSRNTFSVGLGAYAGFKFLDKFDIYTNLKFPLVALSGNTFITIFDKVLPFIYDITLGANYQLSPMIFLGIEANVNNSISLGEATLFSIGAKVGYKF